MWLESMRPYYLRCRGRIPAGEEMIRSFYPHYINKNDVVIEVGANTGGSTLELSKLVSFVYAFEPVPSTFRYLRAFTLGRRNVKAFNVGASDSACNAKFNLCDHPVANSKFHIRKAKYVGYAVVKLVRLGSFKFELKPTSIVMDCEASEVEALKGGSELFNKGSIRSAMIETHYLEDGSKTLDDVISIIKNYGFEFKIEEDSVGLPWVLATRPDVTSRSPT